MEQNSIVDAERHRRTPRLSAISGKAIRVWVLGLGRGRFNVRRWQILATLGDIWQLKQRKSEQLGSKYQ